MRQVLANNRKSLNFLTQKEVAVAHRRWSLLEIPTVRLWLGTFWCLDWRSLMGGGRTWRFDCNSEWSIHGFLLYCWINFITDLTIKREPGVTHNSFVGLEWVSFRNRFDLVCVYARVILKIKERSLVNGFLIYAATFLTKVNCLYTSKSL